MDFVEGLPPSANANCILVVVDKFNKFRHFIPLAHPYTAHLVATTFFNSMYRLHGLLASIISKRFWQNLFKLSGTTLRMSSSYHPQSYGQIERVNQCLETYLCCFTHACPNKWKEWIPVVEFWYNNCFHSALGPSPFEALYGRKPRTLGIDPSTTASGNLDQWLRERAFAPCSNMHEASG
jgi:hypothetical protein